MIWWFLILGLSTLVVVCVAIAMYMRVRQHMQGAEPGNDQSGPPPAGDGPST